MAGIVQQLGLDQTFFVQFLIVGIFFLVLSNIFFKPFQKLIQARHKRLIEDREAAEKILGQADAKFDEYKKKLAEERLAARQDYESLLNQAKKDESHLLMEARNEAKKITQEAVDSAQKQKDQIQKQLEADVEGLAQQIADNLLMKRS